MDPQYHQEVVDKQQLHYKESQDTVSRCPQLPANERMSVRVAHGATPVANLGRRVRLVVSCVVVLAAVGPLLTTRCEKTWLP